MVKIYCGTVQSENIIVGINMYNQFTDKNLYADNLVRKYY
jgi:hypothetical protein